MIGGAAYPNPSTMASNVGVNPPVLSIPVMEHINLPAKAIAPYIPELQINNRSRKSGNHEKTNPLLQLCSKSYAHKEIKKGVQNSENP